MKLKYIGRAWLPGVPARDLSEEEAEQYGIDYLINSGLYEKVGRPKEPDIEPEEHEE